MDNTQKKDRLTRIFDFVVYILNYIYQDLSAIPKDFLTEIHLRYYKHNKNPEKRILGVWDFNQRFSKSGDFMLIIEYLSVLRFELGLDTNKKNIDLCFIDDKTHYNSKQLRFSKTYLFKKNIQTLVITNPFIDSVFLFKSNAEFEQFYQQNKERYLRWPPTVSSTVVADIRKIEAFYKKNRFIPELSLPNEVLSEIYDFYEKNVYPSIPIIINIRKNVRSINRNTKIEEIKNFINHYKNDPKYKFIIICNKSEIPEEFRELQNVLFSKDFFDSVEYDLGLIKTSYLSMFPSSGMATFAWFSGVPFMMYGDHGYNKYTSAPKGGKFNFCTEYQRHYHQVETSKFLINEFESLVNYLRVNKINNPIKHQVGLKKYDAPF